MKSHSEASVWPTFLGVGAQRCGTTWLFENLRAHPGIYLPERKEINFFSDIDGNYDRGPEWYADHFRRGGGQVARGEITPEYFVDPQAPGRIKQLLGDVKIVICVRHPVDRAYSSFKRSVREREWQGTFDDFVNENRDLCVDRGLYARQLQNYLQHFSRDDVLVAFFESIDADPHAFLARVYEFLGVDATFVSPLALSRFNIGVSSTNVMLQAVRGCRDVAYGIPGMRRAVKNLERTGFGNRLMKTMLSTASEDRSALRAKYTHLFEEDMRRFDDMIGGGALALWESPA